MTPAHQMADARRVSVIALMDGQTPGVIGGKIVSVRTASGRRTVTLALYNPFRCQTCRGTGDIGAIIGDCLHKLGFQRAGALAERGDIYGAAADIGLVAVKVLD